MKKYIAATLTLGLAVFAQASIIQFDISPTGTDMAVGLSPLNEVPGITNSLGSGNEIGTGITFDTDTGLLTVMLGYGSAAGFTDLTGVPFGMHIHGPAGVGTNGPVVVNLLPYHFAAGDPAMGGIVYGVIAFPTNEADNLLAGLNYINIHTTNYAGGEIRGQLIPFLNHPPVVVCPEPSTVECSWSTTLTAQVSDPDGDALVVVWSVNGVAIQTNELAAGSTVTPVGVNLYAEFPMGTNTVTIIATDTKGNTADCSTTVTVVDTIPPVITKLTATPDKLWPPNHKMVQIQVKATVTDGCGPTTWKIISVTSSEAVNAIGSGNTAPDWQITGDHTLNLRAERSGKTGPRIYTIKVVAKDAAGNVSESKTLIVSVNHNA